MSYARMTSTAPATAPVPMTQTAVSMTSSPYRQQAVPMSTQQAVPISPTPSQSAVPLSPAPTNMAAPFSPGPTRVAMPFVPSQPTPMPAPGSRMTAIAPSPLQPSGQRMPVMIPQSTAPRLQASVLPTRMQTRLPPSMLTERAYYPYPAAPVTVVPVTQTQSFGPMPYAPPTDYGYQQTPTDVTARRNALIVGGILALVVAGGVTYWLVKKKGS